jgi:hypothetical protein
MLRDALKTMTMMARGVVKTRWHRIQLQPLAPQTLWTCRLWTLLKTKFQQFQPFDVFVGVAARDYLQKILSRTVIPPHTDLTTNTIWPGFEHTSAELNQFEMIMSDIINFTRGYPVSCDNILLAEKPSTTRRLDRQVAKAHSNSSRVRRLQSRDSS